MLKVHGFDSPVVGVAQFIMVLIRVEKMNLKDDFFNSKDVFNNLKDVFNNFFRYEAELDLISLFLVYLSRMCSGSVNKRDLFYLKNIITNWTFYPFFGCLFLWIPFIHFIFPRFCADLTPQHGNPKRRDPYLISVPPKNREQMH